MKELFDSSSSQSQCTFTDSTTDGSLWAAPAPAPDCSPHTTWTKTYTQSPTAPTAKTQSLWAAAANMPQPRSPPPTEHSIHNKDSLWAASANLPTLYSPPQSPTHTPNPFAFPHNHNATPSPHNQILGHFKYLYINTSHNQTLTPPTQSLISSILSPIPKPSPTNINPNLTYICMNHPHYPHYPLNVNDNPNPDPILHS